MRSLSVAFAALAAASAAFGGARFGKESVDVDAPGGTFQFFYPEVQASGGQQRPSKVEPSGKTAVCSYPSGAKLELAIGDDHLSYRMLETPSGMKDVKIHLVMPVSLGAQGAKWTVGGKSGAFPKDKGGVKLYQGNAGDFTSELGGKKFSVLFPEKFCWTELQDLREWNWGAFGIAFTTPFNADKRIVVVPFGPDAAKLADVRGKVESAFFAKNGGGSAPKAAKAAAPTLALRMQGGGVKLACGSMGDFELAHPKLKIGGEDRSKPIETKVDGNVCRLKFKGGGELTVKLDGRRIHYHLDRKPDGYDKPFQDMFVPMTFNQGGKWYVDSKSGEFPLAKGPTKLFQGNTKTFAVSGPDNAKLSLKFSTAPWMEVQDNREWGWAIFWNGFHLPGGLSDWTVDVALDTSAFARKVLVDKFGQVTRDFKGKVKDEAEFIAVAKSEDAYYRSLGFAGKMAERKMALDKFGGLAGAGAKIGLRKTGYFHCEKKTIKGKERWLLVDPEGNPFFHLGICCFSAGSDDATDVSGREDAFAWLPPHDEKFVAAWKDKPGDWWNGRAVSFYKANAIRKYGKFDDSAMSARYVERARAVGFNSIGAFSPWPKEAKDRNFPYVGFVSLGSPKMIPSVRGMFDPFDEKSRSEVARAMKGMAKNAGDPLIIGYSLANEQGLEDIPRAIPALDATWAAKRAFVKSLERKYGTIAKFNAAWDAKEGDFRALEAKGLAVTTKAAFADVNAFKEQFLEEYYSLVEREFRANDPNHMLIGNRWQPGTANDETLCRVAGRHMDVISINYYTAGVDRKFITRLYGWTGGKPQFWSEFYYTSTKESNCGPSGFDLATQKERGMAYRNYVEAAAELGFVTGIEWFTLIDQAATGRFFEGQNGERANTGLFDVLDRPYKDMFAEMLQAHLDVYPVWLGASAAWKFDDPRYNGSGNATRSYSVGRPIAKMAVDGKQDGYPLRPPERISSSRLVMGRDAEGLEASFKGSWDDQNLYLLVTVTDASPQSNKEKGQWIWNGDGIEVFLGAESPDKGGPMLFTDRQVLVSAASGEAFVPKNAKNIPVKGCALATPDGKGHVIEVAIPWSLIEYTPKANDTILFDLAVDDAPAGGSRVRQLMWNGSQRNSSDRSAWGRLTLVP